jgi:hypothetical protein
MKIGDKFVETTQHLVYETEVLAFSGDGGCLVRRRWRWRDSQEKQCWEETVKLTPEQAVKIETACRTLQKGGG